MNTSDINRLLDNSATIETKIDILPRDETESIVTISNNDSVQSWEYSDTRYVPDNGFIGMFVERTLEGTLHNITEDFNIENREIILHLGIRVYDSESQTYNTNFYSLGNFIVDKPDSDEVKDNTKFTAKDYTIKFNRTFNPDFTDSEYTKSFTTLLSEQGSVTALWLAKYTCKQSGVELGSKSFANSTFNITSNQFQNGEQCRDIIKAIAKLACTWARIDWDNKLYLDFDVKFAVEQDYNNITKDDYYSLTIQKDSFGPINKVVFGSSIIDGDYSFVSDENSISQHGENVVTIYDNPILYTEELREEAVKVGTRLVGLTYTPVEMETIGHPWLKGNELITVLDSAYNIIYTYPFDRVIKYDGHIKTEIKSYAPTKVQADFTYQGTGTSKNAQKQTKIILDRANQQITSLIEKTDETTSQITSINQNLDKIELDVDTLNTKFESIGVTSKTVEGNPIHITDAGAYDIERLYLEGNNYQKVTQQGRNICPTDINDWELGQWTTEGNKNIHQNRIRVKKLVPCKPNTTYYNQTFLDKRLFAIRTFKADGTFNTSIGGVTRGGTFTTDANSYYLAITMYSEASATEDLIAMIENGEVKPYITLNSETNRNFEEYIPNSPSPDHPSDIEVIEGSVDVDVVGKNLANYNDSVGKIFNFKIGDIIAGKNYSLFLNIDGVIDFHLRYGDGGTKIKTFYSVKGENVLNFTATEDAILFFNGWGNASGSFNNISEIMLLEGTYNIDTIGEYEPYKSTTASLDLQDEFVGKCTTLDTLDVVTGKLNKNVGRVQLNGLESLTIEVNSNVPYTRFSTTILNGRGTGVQNRYPIKSTHFKNIFSGGHDVGGAFIYQSKLFIYLPLDITSVEQAKAWLAVNKPIFYYDLAEPYEVQLDQTLIGLYVGVNNIKINTNIDPSYLSLTYLTDVPLNAQYATKTQLQLNKDNITSVVQDTLTLNTDLTNLQSLVGTETTNLKNSLGDLTNNLEENYATNNDVLTVTNSVANIQTSLNQQIEITKDIQVNGVSKVKTTTGFTFDENGMTVTKTNADTKTTIDEDGMVVYSTTGSDNTEMLVVDSKGVVAENVTVRTYLVVGKNSRFQDYETGTGCFYIGE